MKRSLLAIAMSAALGLGACADTTATRLPLLDDADVTADIAASSGEAMASALVTMMANEADGALTFVSGNSTGPSANSVSHTRSRTCFDAAGAVVADCRPPSSVRKIVTHVTIDGTREGTHTNRGGATVTWTGAVHRVSDDTLTRNFNTAEPPAETSRTHAGVTTGNDTTSFTDGTVSRIAREATVDSVRAVTWNLPRSSNPWPVSGSIVRNASVNVTITRGGQTETRSLTRRVQITFPADAQGNVVLQINDQTCNLNLVTRKVTNCA